MKTLKIEPQTHKRLTKLKAELDQTTLSETIDILIYFYCQEHEIQYENWEVKNNGK